MNPPDARTAVAAEDGWTSAADGAGPGQASQSTASRAISTGTVCGPVNSR